MLNMKSIKFGFVFLLMTPFLIFKGFTQEKVVIDKIVAVVGNSAILKSDIYNQQRQLESQGITFGANAQCELLDEMLYQKLLYNQAIIDSVEVSDQQVEQILDRRLRFFIQQIGSREQLEAYYGKSIEELKDEFRPLVREQELSQMMESKITRNVRVTPSEVKRFFNNLPPDSIPTVESETEMAQIVIKPPVDPEEIALTKERLNDIRDRIIQGESFNTMAILYSEDPGSARRGGELGFHGRGELFAEFEATSFGLRPGEISEIIETQAGFHIIQMIERRGEQINVRHILIQPQISPLQLSQARNKLDSIRNLIRNEEFTFAEAAKKFSDDPGKVSGGIMINPFTNTTRFKNDEIDRNLFFVIDRLDEGQISNPVPMMTEEGKQAFRIVKVTRRIEAHPASLDGDYDFIQQLALNEKRMKAVQDWIRQRIGNTYIFINEDFHHCNFTIQWSDQVAKAPK
ncbi:MAG: peptidylprolyl isomerase [Bacteroidetes bacterium]|nr:MAG: peptidylprolyl isomerase [Bacteroidota bacterium]